MYIQQIQISEFTCNLFLPEDYYAGNRTYPVIYVNGDVPIQEIISEIGKAGYGADFILLSVQPGEWNDDFTPWSAPAFRKGEKNAGRAGGCIYMSFDRRNQIIYGCKLPHNAGGRTHGAVRLFSGWSDGGIHSLQDGCVRHDRKSFRFALV